MTRQTINSYAKIFKAFIIALFILTLSGSALAQTSYRIKVKADGRYLHEDGLGDRLLSTRYQVSDDYTKFILEPQSDGSYRIRVRATGRYLHEDGSNDRLLSTRYQPFDDFTKFYLEGQGDGSFRIRVKATGRYLHEDGWGDKIVSTRYQPYDDFTRFYFEKVVEDVRVSFVNRTNRQVAVYWVNNGREVLYNNLAQQSSYVQQTYVSHVWRLRINGRLVGTYSAKGTSNQTVTITTRPINAGPIWNQQDAEYKCRQLAANNGRTWTGQWWTTVEGRMSVCEMAEIY